MFGCVAGLERGRGNFKSLEPGGSSVGGGASSALTAPAKGLKTPRVFSRTYSKKASTVTLEGYRLNAEVRGTIPQRKPEIIAGPLQERLTMEHLKRIPQYMCVCVVVTAILALSHNSGIAAITSPSKLQVNIGAIPIDKYTSTNWDAANGRAYVKNCSTGVTVRQCIQAMLDNFKAQNVEAVRFFYLHCGGAYNTALTGCDSDNPGQTAALNNAWVTNLNLFFADVKARQIHKIVPSPGFAGAYNQTDPNPTNPTNRKAPNDGQREVSVSDPCTGTTKSLVFWPAAPFGMSKVVPTGPYLTDHNNSYNCSPANPKFVGWNRIYDVVNAVLAKAKANALLVEEFDLLNEMDLSGNTVLARLIVDNKHTSSGNPNVLDVFRYYMGFHSYDWKKVNYSTRASDTNVAAYDCGSIYGDSARILMLSARTAGIAGGLIGRATLTRTNGLHCGGSTATMLDLPVYHDQSTVTNVHVYPLVLGTTGGSGVQAEATKTFNAVKAFLDSYAPGGWRGSLPSIYNSPFVVGETWSQAYYGSPSKSCETLDNQGTTLGSQTVNGFNASGLAGRTAGTVFRPWYRVEQFGMGAPAGCYPFPPHTINPPYTPSP